MGAWRKTAKWKRKRVGLLIDRDGHACWLCTRPLSRAATRPGRRISLEHLTPRVVGGDDRLDNLVLCHAACNRHLGERPVAKKLEIQAKWHREAKRRGAPPSRPCAGAKTAARGPAPPASAPKSAGKAPPTL